jgi:hypothetical protein
MEIYPKILLKYTTKQCKFAAARQLINCARGKTVGSSTTQGPQRTLHFIEAMSRFEDRRCASQPSAVSVFSSPLHGDGVVCHHPFVSGDVLFAERPLCCMQTLSNKQDVLVCSQCLQFIGPLDLHLKVLAREVSRQSLDDFICRGVVVPCTQGCGEFYCSEHCRDGHWSSHHELLCTGRITEEEAADHPLIKFKVHAVSTNEIFILVADVFAKMALEISQYMQYMPKAEAVSRVLGIFDGYVRENWWDAAVAPVGTNPKTLKKTLKRLVDTSYNLLSEALSLRERELDDVLTAEFMSRTIGMFEQNNVGIRLENPVVPYLKSLTTGTREVKELAGITRTIIDLMDGKSLNSLYSRMCLPLLSILPNWACRVDSVYQ